ncbi:hypothetical protein TNCT_77211 [Trichonephila clavata]|uniref:Uncharacterized protein n=1 Tax=Trichonephila clavata TaxID=2740835 RepID=A0A8X6IVI3_TRICU|nr:hypothetical protein TNCT_77211 [Trichonephila clavata]
MVPEHNQIQSNDVKKQKFFIKHMRHDQQKAVPFCSNYSSRHIQDLGNPCPTLQWDAGYALKTRHHHETGAATMLARCLCNGWELCNYRSTKVRTLR